MGSSTLFGYGRPPLLRRRAVSLPFSGSDLPCSTESWPRSCNVVPNRLRVGCGGGELLGRGNLWAINRPLTDHHVTGAPVAPSQP